MDKLTFCFPLQSHIDYVAEHMRHQDRDEVIAATGAHDVRAMLTTSVGAAGGCSWVALNEDKPVAIFGVGHFDPKVGVPWMLATHDVFQTPRASRALVSKGRWYIQRMLANYPRLENYVDTRNERAIRWLRHLGFTIHPAAPYGPYGYLFHRFDMVAD